MTVRNATPARRQARSPATGRPAGQGDQQDGQDYAAVPHVTVMWVCADAPPQVTVIGHAPGVVFAPTFHIQLTLPALSEFFATRPAAVDGPDL